MRLYHFLRAKHALDDIEHHHIKVAKIEELNDPFELWCISQKDRKLRTALVEWKRRQGERFGLICFSERRRNPLMWSHYARKHRGMCLGLDVPEGRLKPVNYIAKRPVIRSLSAVEFSSVLPFSKYIGWKYEREWRQWIPFAECETSNGHHFCPLKRIGKLREVIAGALCPVTKQRIERALAGDADVHMFKARLSRRKFEIVKNLRGFAE